MTMEPNGIFELAHEESPKSKGNRQSGVFRRCALDFLQKCSSSTNRVYNVTEMSLTFGQQRRRFYDLASMMEALGICSKVQNDSFIWRGFENSKSVIYEKARERGVFDPNKSLEDIIPNVGCISIPKLCEDFILCFLALETQTLNIISLTHFFSRNNSRYKTTRCKLYQVASILEMMGIIRKSNIASQFTLNISFFASASLDMSKKYLNPSSFESLLNRANPSMINPAILKRRATFEIYNKMALHE